MALTNLTPADNFLTVETKLDATIDAVNEISGGTTGQMLVKSSNTDFDVEWTDQPVTVTKDVSRTTFSGLQAITGSYVTISGLTYTTPNDGITRYYQIIAEAQSRIELNVNDPSWTYRIYNSTDSTTLYERPVIWEEPTGTVDSFIVSPQTTLLYYGAIAPNKTINFQVVYSTSTTTMDVQYGSLLLVEINR